ncbi:hypothetical protein ASPVEDRAFT_401209 [Aspergillus versicolor CBS 583.65]|uniref:Uncharacterized protein n=1 Tax=Aspergillus versicolor CBS 583.65 TaxID=1036611 RepID=A0A1L9Q3W4_ASPVE|nr:uncharacterized protein ASPVEDRAFT_401209 [Aspergillus versicolor CBS 583.65]OJJ08451.1 hypothetical protein ASPVEDRAFT_401209 [Aspergillus versicolor CBS 583.65]
MWPGHSDIFCSAQTGKRERESHFKWTSFILSIGFLISIRIITPQVHTLDTSFHLGYAGPLKHCNSECSSHLQCLNRKRRALQQPSFYSQQTPHLSFALRFYFDAIQNKAVAQPICLPTNLNISPPALFPRTPASRPSQHISGASASFLRSYHICHRKPTILELLEAYADCDLCGQHACFICLRRCDVADCHSRAGQENQERGRSSLEGLQSRTDASILE